jgi:hypothetical protein
MFFDDFLHRGQTQTGAGPLGGKERFEDLADVLGGNGGSVVLDHDLHVVGPAGFVLGDFNVKVPAGRHSFQGILEDAEEHLLHFGFVAPDLG